MLTLIIVCSGTRDSTNVQRCVSTAAIRGVKVFAGAIAVTGIDVGGIVVSGDVVEASSLVGVAAAVCGSIGIVKGAGGVDSVGSMVKVAANAVGVGVEGTSGGGNADGVVVAFAAVAVVVTECIRLIVVRTQGWWGERGIGSIGTCMVEAAWMCKTLKGERVLCCVNAYGIEWGVGGTRHVAAAGAVGRCNIGIEHTGSVEDNGRGLSSVGAYVVVARTWGRQGARGVGADKLGAIEVEGVH